MTERNPVALPDEASTGLRWRPGTPADVDDWLALILRIAEAERPAWHEQRGDLEQIFASTKDDPRLDILLGFSPEGVLRAFGRVSKNPDGPKALARGGVDPLWQRRGIGTAVLAWQQDRTRSRFAADSMAPPLMRVQCEEKSSAQQALFSGAGFTVVRYFNEMRRPLTGVLPDVPLADGLTLVAYSEELSEAVRAAHNDAFRDQWGSEPRDQEAWSFMVGHSLSRPDWSCVVLDAVTGDVAGYQLASYDPEVLTVHGRAEGYTELLGVPRRWRGRGIAPALLADAMRRFRADGMDYAALDVDTENPSGALGLYERMGYTAVDRSLAWEKVL